MDLLHKGKKNHFILDVILHIWKRLGLPNKFIFLLLFWCCTCVVFVAVNGKYTIVLKLKPLAAYALVYLWIGMVQIVSPIWYRENVLNSTQQGCGNSIKATDMRCLFNNNIKFEISLRFVRKLIKQNLICLIGLLEPPIFSINIKIIERDKQKPLNLLCEWSFALNLHWNGHIFGN